MPSWMPDGWVMTVSGARGPPGQGGDRELEVLAGLDVGGDVPAAEQFVGHLWQAPRRSPV